MPSEWLPWFALGLTILLEVPPCVSLLRKDHIPLGESFAVGIAMNCITHPLAWQAIQSWRFPWLGVETAVVIVEMSILCLVFALPWTRALWIAGLINAITALIGLLIPWRSLMS